MKVKRILSAGRSVMIASIVFFSALLFTACEKDPYPNRQHITMLIVEHEYDKREDAYCELTEQENHKTIEIEFDAKYRHFMVLALFEDGSIKHLTDENRIDCDVMHYISPEREINYKPSNWIFEVGTYEICFSMKSNSTLAFPFRAKLTVKIIPKEIL